MYIALNGCTVSLYFTRVKARKFVLTGDKCTKAEIYAIIWHLLTPRTEIAAKRIVMKNNRIRTEQNTARGNGKKRNGETGNCYSRSRPIACHYVDIL